MPNEKKRDVRFKDLFRGVEFHEDDVAVDIKVPDSFYFNLTDYFMERSYLNDIVNKDFVIPAKQHSDEISWLRITQLPVNPDNSDSYDLLSRWQGVLSALHAWNYRLIFLLLRKDGKTNLYLGTSTIMNELGGVVSASKAAEQVREAASGSMPGIGLEAVSTTSDIMLSLSSMTHVGAVTGIPSFREEDKIKVLQTLDPLAFGLKTADGEDRNYAMLVIADPIPDKEVADLIRRHRELSSQIHTDVKTAISTGKTSSDQGKVGLGVYGGQSIGKTIGGALGGMLGGLLGVPDVGIKVGSVIGALGGGIAASKEKKINLGASSSVNKDYLDKFAEYAEQLIDKHITRLNEGRNLGFWNTGVYLLGGYEDIRTTAGMLRSIYSGKETYLEPIRIHCFPENLTIGSIVKGFNLLPLIDKDYVQSVGRKEFEVEGDAWHILGKPYQYVSTPMNTSELSLATSLPRRDVPGLRFVKTAVRFASNPAEQNGDVIDFGNVVDMGVRQATKYRLDPNILVRHAFITGVTGCGKSTTCKYLLNSILKRDIPFLVIEPAKDDYVRWAIETNKTLPPEKQIKIYMPGAESRFPEAEPFRLNLFQPAVPKGMPENLLMHSENLSMLLNACLPSEEVVPILIDETVNYTLMKFAEGYDTELFGPWKNAYPKVDNLIDSAKKVIDNKTYEARTKENFKEVLLTRFEYLMRGTRGKILNVGRSVDFDELFAHPTVINISCLAGSKEKALIMSLLLLALYEYRSAKYQGDAEYRAQAQENRLMHLTLIEEAHNVLSAPPSGISAGDPRVASAELFSNILSEIRGYGEGIAVVDQTPVKMIPDVIKNTNLKICHRLVSADDCAMMSSGLALREEQKTLIPSLEIGNAIVCGDMDDAAAWIRIPAPKK